MSDKSTMTRIKDRITRNIDELEKFLLPDLNREECFTINAKKQKLTLLCQQENKMEQKRIIEFDYKGTYEIIYDTDEHTETVETEAKIKAEVKIYDQTVGKPIAVKILEIKTDKHCNSMPIRLSFFEYSLEQHVGMALEEARHCRIPEQCHRTIADFVTFKFHQRYEGSIHPECSRTYFNLLLYGGNMEQVTEYAIFLTDLFEDDTESHAVREEQGIDGYNKYNSLYESEWDDFRAIYIYDCKPKPYEDIDAGTGSSKERSSETEGKYTKFWNFIADYAKKNPKTTMIAGMTEDVYKESIALNTELNFRIFGHRIYVPEMDLDRVVKYCLEEFRGSSFHRSPKFDSALAKYVRTIYQRAELKGLEFAKDVVNRVYVLYFSKDRDEDDRLTEDCIPKYRTEVRTAEDVLEKLHDMIGLQSVKDTFDRIYKKQIANPETAKKGPYHMMFYGNPGTGKTTVAKMTAELLWHAGVLKSKKCVEASVGDLVSVWKNNSAAKTKAKVQEALDGVLFIDEAYGLAGNPGGAQDALNILIQEMQNYQDRLVVIMAGYEDKMEELLKSNSGLSSRIAYKLRFEDFSVEELREIFLKRCAEIGFTLDPSANDVLEECLKARKVQEFFGNGRDVANLLQEVQGSWSQEYYELVRTEGKEKAQLPKVFYPKHFLDVMPPKNDPTIENMVGLETVKKQLEKFHNQVKYLHAIKKMGMKKLPETYMHMLFMGNPGTGKTTVAKMVANDLYSLGVLKTNRLIVVERKDIIASYKGETAKRANELIGKAIGGVMFIDEAYSLEEAGDAGQEAIETIMTAMVEHKEDTIFIFAGYPKEMNRFLESNPGIPSRIGYTFLFEDYTTDELIEIFQKQMSEAGFLVMDEAYSKVRDIMEYFSELPKFGNGRFVEQLISHMIAKRAEREYSKLDYNCIEACDVPEIGEMIQTSAMGMRLQDPKKLSVESRKRTVYHELGHAIAIYALDPAMEIEKISVKSRAFSLGRVSLKETGRNRTEEELRHEIVISLAGRSAERIFCGNCDEGCVSDYERAKEVADAMVNRYGMCEIGTVTPEDLLRQGEQEAAEIVKKYRDCLEKLAGELLEGREFTGEEFRAAVKKNISET